MTCHKHQMYKGWTDSPVSAMKEHQKQILICLSLSRGVKCKDYLVFNFRHLTSIGPNPSLCLEQLSLSLLSGLIPYKKILTVSRVWSFSNFQGISLWENFRSNLPQCLSFSKKNRVFLHMWDFCGYHLSLQAFNHKFIHYL